MLFCVALPPPVDVRATQSSSSAPVEVKWSPPTDGDVNITGYRIFFGSGQNFSVSRGATSIGIRITTSYDSERVFLRSEADGLFSELINASVGEDRKSSFSKCHLCFMHSPFILSERTQDDQYCTCDVKLCSPNGLKRNEVGAAVGVAILVMCLVIAVITVTAILCWWRWVREREVNGHRLIVHS